MMQTSAAIGKLAGKVALVTASTSGIGLAMARRLGMDGAKVVVSSRRQENVDRAVANLEAENIDVFGQVCHIGNPDHRHRLIEETVKRNGGIDIFVSNAAANPHVGPILECSESELDKIFDMNVKSTFFFCKEVIPHMKERGGMEKLDLILHDHVLYCDLINIAIGGSIVLVSTIIGYIPHAQTLPYTISKTGVLALVKALTPQCATMNIRVNGIAPGIFDVLFGRVLASDSNLVKRLLLQIPSDRLSRLEDFAGIVSFLVSRDADYITGENVVIGGGAHSRL